MKLMFATLLIALVDTTKGDGVANEIRLKDLERITKHLLKEALLKDKRIEKLESLVRDQSKQLETQNEAIKELSEDINRQKYEHDKYSEEISKRVDELESLIRSDYATDDKTIRLEENSKIIDDLKGKDGQSILQNKANMKDQSRDEADIQQFQHGQQVSNNNPRITRQSSDNVAFHAYLKGNRCYGSHETFVFDVEETDVGGGYNVNDGIFDVPVTGTYVFTVTTISNLHRYYSAEIIINGVVKGISFADSEEVGDIHSGTATIVVHVNVGDHVFVRRGTAATNNCDVYSEDFWGRSTFSGWLLF